MFALTQHISNVGAWLSGQSHLEAGNAKGAPLLLELYGKRCNLEPGNFTANWARRASVTSVCATSVLFAVTRFVLVVCAAA